MEQEETRWCIDTDWLESNNRSLLALARGSLCPKCRKRLTVEEPDISVTDLITTIRECCSADADFISRESPILENIFRLFLANGNQALDLIKLGRQLSERRGVDTYRTSVELLSRLLKNDEYYGIRRVEEAREPGS